jgi:hypothetical protein
MVDERRTMLETYQQADPETQAAYRVGLLRLRNLDAPPEAWTCTRCSATTLGEDILISYDPSGTPLPHCPTEGCTAYGDELKPAAA